ncbi:unnamed protein product [Symbiodinium sp. CCMP2592]|nr:unnamed protein product [Symbiodinium sp. CCMP2592]
MGGKRSDRFLARTLLNLRLWHTDVLIVDSHNLGTSTVAASFADASVKNTCTAAISKDDAMVTWRAPIAVGRDAAEFRWTATVPDGSFDSSEGTDRESRVSSMRTRWVQAVLGAHASSEKRSSSWETRTATTASVQPSSAMSSIGRACLPGYGTSRRAVSFEPKGRRRQVPVLRRVPDCEQATQSAAPELMTAAALATAEWAGKRPDVEQRRAQTAAARLEKLEEMRQAKQRYREQAKALVAATWRPEPRSVETADVIERRRRINCLVFPDTQAQEQTAATLLVQGTAGERRRLGGGIGTGRLTLQVKPQRNVSSFAEMFQKSVGQHPYFSFPFSSGEWKY